MFAFFSKYGTFILEYIWVPIIVPLFAFVIKFIFSDKLLYVKEIKKNDDNDIASFSRLYNERIHESLRIGTEEILYFIEANKESSIEHHLYVCKKFNKTVGFVKFMISKDHKYIFVAYVAIDISDKAASAYGMKVLVKKLVKKYFKPQIASCIVTEIEQSTNGGYRNAMSLLVSRYARSLGKKCYYVDMPYIQPKMPDDNNAQTYEELLSFLYIPYYAKANNQIAKNEFLSIIESIYFDIYGPSCDPSLGCDSDEYNNYLASILALYQNDIEDYIKLIPLERS